MASNNLSFSIVIPTYRRHEELSECLNNLAYYFEVDVYEQHGIQIEVIVTDDAHDPELRALLLQLYPWCHYTSGPSRGPAANRNHGARTAIGEWIVFTDDDCLPQPGWIEAFSRAADECDVLEGQTSALGTRYRADMECPINESGGYLWSCNFAIRRTVFLEMGGFDETFPAPAMEDVELNARINKANLRRRFLPHALVLHPWRRRKGLDYVKAHARSVANYVRLHPEKSDYFSFTSQSLKSLRSIKNAIQDSYTHMIFRGSLRRIALEMTGHYFAWFYVRRLGSTATK
ncbi:MAG: glycosyltransferase [Prochlorococcaceae cyanobacterium]